MPRRKCPPSTQFDPNPQEANEIFMPKRTNNRGMTARSVERCYIDAVTTLLEDVPNNEARLWLQKELDDLKTDCKLMTSQQLEIFKEICR